MWNILFSYYENFKTYTNKTGADIYFDIKTYCITVISYITIWILITVKNSIN